MDVDYRKNVEFNFFKLNKETNMNLFQHPQFKTTIKIIHSDSRNGEFLLTPLEKNIGTTLGNTIRRIILGFIPGCAITSVYIKGVNHEFSSFSGMKEDLIDFLLALQSLLISMDHYGPSTISIRKKGPAIITAKDIITTKGIKILNSDQYLCTLNEFSDFHVDLIVECGTGYLPAAYDLSFSINSQTKKKINEIKLDTVFSPVTHVCYRLKNFTFYEEVLLHVQTNGTVSPKKVFESSILFLSNKFNLIKNKNLL